MAYDVYGGDTDRGGGRSNRRDTLTQMLLAQYGLVPPDYGPGNGAGDPQFDTVTADPASENVSDGFSAMNDPGPGYGSMGFASQGPTSAATQAQAAITDAMGGFQSAPAQEAAPSPTNMGVFDTSENGVNANPGSVLAAGIPGFGLFGAFTNNNNPDEAQTGDINGPGWTSPNPDAQPDAPSPSPSMQTAQPGEPDGPATAPGFSSAAPGSPGAPTGGPGFGGGFTGPSGFSSSTDASVGMGTGYGSSQTGYGGDIAGGLGTGFGVGTGPDAGSGFGGGFSAGFDAGVSAATGGGFGGGPGGTGESGANTGEGGGNSGGDSGGDAGK